MYSQNAQLLNAHPLAHILSTFALISVVAPFLLFALSPTASCNDISPLSRLTMQKWPRETQSSPHAPGLSTPSNLSRIVEQSPQLSICFPRPHSHHPFNSTSVYPIPGVHLPPPSTKRKILEKNIYLNETHLILQYINCVHT